jgi:hypothetical protein
MRIHLHRTLLHKTPDIPCAASPCRRPTWPTPPAARSAASSSRSARSSPSASVASSSPWHQAVPTSPPSRWLIAPSPPQSTPAERGSPALQIGRPPQKLRRAGLYPHSVCAEHETRLPRTRRPGHSLRRKPRCAKTLPDAKSATYKTGCEISGLELSRPNRHPKESSFYRFFTPLRFHTTKTHSGHAAISYSISSSARIRIKGGMDRPSALAVLRLITKVKTLGCSTGRSPGLAPRRILSISTAT